MAKIGLVTFYIDNYGSLLQAYATKTFLEKNGFDPVLLEKAPLYPSEEEVRDNMQKHPESVEDFNRFMASLQKNDSLVPEKSLQCMEEFRRNRLKISHCSMDELRELAESDEYDRFIAGSDQIWNTSMGMVYGYFFLRFVPPHKRIALCPSFGSGTVYEYLKEDLAEVLNEYKYLSAREDDGVSIIKELTGRDVVRLPDPSFFLTKEEWQRFGGEKDGEETGYILLHFLDKPYDVAVNTVKRIARETGRKVRCFAANHEAFSDITDGETMTGGPEDYIRAIRNAAVVCTDSFHSTAFSIHLGTAFYSFDRQYVHGVSQISRITTLLNRFGLLDRLIPDEDHPIDITDMAINTDVESIKKQEREVLEKYLLDALKH